jgi:diguanylate cyclase (GGDEF)-like protein
MSEQRIKVFLVEDDSGDVDLIQEMLSTETRPGFDLEHTIRLQPALKHLAKQTPDVVLLDLALPDSRGLKTFTDLHAQSPDIPIVVLTGLNDETIALEAVRQGAQDYLVKGQISGKILSRVLRYAIERHRMQSAIRSLALVDELTSLYNRRGFKTLSEERLRLARRTKRGVLFYFVDLDGLKLINDTHGHTEGDRALVKTAEILKETFRTSDIIARVGGDEFAISAIEDRADSAPGLITRLEQAVQRHNAQNKGKYTLGLSVGVARSDPREKNTLEDLMAQADKALYEQKRTKHLPGPAQ